MHARVALHKSREARVALLFHLEGARAQRRAVVGISPHPS